MNFERLAECVAEVDGKTRLSPNLVDGSDRRRGAVDSCGSRCDRCQNNA